MPRRGFTLGRAFALLILGIGLGTTLFVAHRLRPQTLELEVAKALKQILLAEHTFDGVVVGLDTGIEVRGLRVYYPHDPGEARVSAAEIERLVLTVDHRDLLAGQVTIRQVDVYGIKLRLKAGKKEQGTPSMPGIFASQTTESVEIPDWIPDVRVYPGERGSRVEVLEAAPLAEGVTFGMEIASATGEQQRQGYLIEAKLQGARAERIDPTRGAPDSDLKPHVGDVYVTLQVEKANRRLLLNVRAEKLRWSRNDVLLLSEDVRAHLPPVEIAAEADAGAAVVIALPGELRSLTATATLRDIAGVFGNVHTSERAGLPFGVQDGGGTVVYRYPEGSVDLKSFAADYVSPSGTRGRIKAAAAFQHRRAGRHLDLLLEGKGIEASTEDLRHLLPPDVVEAIIDEFLPAGTFDFSLSVTQRPSLQEKVVASLTMRDGKFDYAGQLDKLTGERFGFRYPLERCAGRFKIETHVPTAHGFAEVIEITGLKGFNPVARPQPGGPEDVAVHARGRAVLYEEAGANAPEDLDFAIDVTHLPIDGKLARAFASTPGGVPYKGFDLAGWASRVSIRIERQGFREPEARASYDVTLEDCSLKYDGFPFPIRKVKGRIFSRDLPVDAAGRHWRSLKCEGLEGEAPEGGTFAAHGEVRQDDLGTQLVDLFIEAKQITIGADLERALLASRAAGTGVADLWRSLRPYGFVGATVTLSGPQSCNIVVDLSQLALRGYQEIECPITQLDGSIAYDEGVIKLNHVSGRIFDAPFHVSGEFKESGAFEVAGAVDGLVLQKAVQRILEAVAPPAARALDQLRIEEQSSFDLILTCRRGEDEGPTELIFSVNDLDVKSRLMDLGLVIQGGPIEVTLDRITAENLHLRSGDTEVRVHQVEVPLDERARTWAYLDATNLDPSQHLERLFGPGIKEALGTNARLDLSEFRAEYLRSERKLILSGALDLRRNEVTLGEALEPTGQVGFSPLTLTLPEREGDPLRFAGVIDFHQLNCNVPLSIRDLGGELRVAEGTLAPTFTVQGALRGCSATLFSRELTDMSLNLVYRPDYLHLGNIDGKAYGGDFEGDAEVYLEEPRAFKVRFQARRVRLGEMLKEDLPRDDPMSGTVEVRLEFESPSGDVQDMRGRGQVRVNEGSLFRVPGLRPILSVLSRVTPLDDEPRFTRAEADFTATGEEFTLHHCRLSTNLNDVDAEGTISIYGDLDLVVQPKVTRLIDLPRLINIPVLSTLRDLWHKVAYEIRLEGTLDSPTIHLRGLPFLKTKAPRFTQSPHAGRPGRVRPRLLP